jgi:cell division protein FtsZ
MKRSLPEAVVGTGGGHAAPMMATPAATATVMSAPPPAAAHHQPHRAEPELGVQPARQAPPRTTPQEEMGLDIPTFLRRQTN